MDLLSVICNTDICNFAWRTFPVTKNLAWELYKPWEGLAHDYNGLEIALYISPEVFGLRTYSLDAYFLTLLC